MAIENLQTYYLLQYNNYYNRIEKRHYSLHAYLPYWIGVQGDCSFNENDGITATQVVNFDMREKGEPDYLIVAEDGEIISRWFITEAKRLRRNQYRLSLQRDLVADFYDKIKDSPLYVERGAVSDGSDLIFNPEGGTYNQIKQSETLLKDESGIGWIVGYIPRDASPGKVEAKVGLNTQGITQVAGIANWTYYDKTTNAGVAYSTVFDTNVFALKGFRGGVTSPVSGYDIEEETSDYTIQNISNWVQAWNALSFQPKGTETTSGLSSPFLYSDSSTTMPISPEEKVALTLLKSTISTKFGTKYPTVLNSSILDGVLPYKDKYILDSNTSKYYRVEVTVGFSLPYFMNDSSITPLSEDYRFWAFVKPTNRLTITLVETSLADAEVTIPNASTRIHTNDGAYDVFFIPYGDITITDGTDFENNTLAALQMGIQIAAVAGAGNVYDVQLLPYHPGNATIIDVNGKLNLSTLASTTYQFINDTLNNHLSVVIWASSINRSFEIEHTISVDNYKESNELDLYRITSPNYASIFEFSPAKNGGVTQFDVDCTFKPFSPYIHVAPKFARLYGQDFNDARGLICGGDFSLPQVTSAWADYQLQNKNYALQFNRQVETLELQNKVQRINDIAGYVAGIGTGAASGAVTGAMMGGPVAGAVGAAVGGAASAVGGAFDLVNNQKLRENNVDQMQDMYRWSLQNIQAIPYSLRNVGAQNANNKIFPFLEYYTCSSAERQLFQNKIKYNGMAVGAIQTLSENLQQTTNDDYQYIKGRFIRLEGFESDFHLANEINNEIASGIYFDVKIK